MRPVEHRCFAVEAVAAFDAASRGAGALAISDDVTGLTDVGGI